MALMCAVMEGPGFVPCYVLLHDVACCVLCAVCHAGACVLGTCVAPDGLVASRPGSHLASCSTSHTLVCSASCPVCWVAYAREASGAAELSFWWETLVSRLVAMALVGIMAHGHQQTPKPMKGDKMSAHPGRMLGHNKAGDGREGRGYRNGDGT